MRLLPATLLLLLAACGESSSITPCVPHCAGRECGDDGCGGVCGTCSAGFECTPDGVCVAKGSTELVDNGLIAASTFVDLDYHLFPNLPAWQAPETYIHVAASGGDYGSIAQAIAAAEAGATIMVSAGRYAERDAGWDYVGLFIDKRLTLMAMPGEGVVVVPATGATYGAVIRAPHVVVRGISFDGFSTIGVLLDEGSRDVVLADLRVTNSEEGVSTWGHALQGLLAFNVTISHVSSLGFDCGVGPCRNWRLENVALDLSGGGSGSGADAFAMESGDNLLLVNVEATGAAADGIDMKGTRVVLYGCYVHHVGRNGVKLWQGGDVINTVIHHTGADASVVTEVGRFRFLHSVLAYHNYGIGASYNMTLGYDERGVTEVEIINSVVFNTSGGAWIDPGANVSIRNSIFHGMENGRVLDHGSRTITIAGGTTQFSPYGSENLLMDPRFDAAMRPMDGSPALDSGVQLDSSYPSHDREGNPRVCGPAPDRGAYERCSPVGAGPRR